MQYKLQHVALDDPKSSTNGKMTSRPSNSGRFQLVSPYNINAEKKKRSGAQIQTEFVMPWQQVIHRQRSAKVMMTVEFHTNKLSGIKITKK
jgi:hypothetical protein